MIQYTSITLGEYPARNDARMGIIDRWDLDGRPLYRLAVEETLFLAGKELPYEMTATWRRVSEATAA